MSESESSLIMAQKNNHLNHYYFIYILTDFEDIKDKKVFNQ